MLKMLWEEMFDDGSGDRDGGPKKGGKIVVVFWLGGVG